MTQMPGQRYDGDHLGSDVYELARPNQALADESVGGRQNTRVRHVVLSQCRLRLGGAHLRLELLLLDVETCKNGLLLIELRLVELQLSRRALGVVVCLLDALRRSRATLDFKRSRWRVASRL